MSSLRVVVSFSPGEPVEAQTQALDDLAQVMRASLPSNARLSRVPELGLPGTVPMPRITAGGEVGLRVFLLEFPDGTSCAEVLRAVGGWFMRHPYLTITVKADGPAGGVSMKLTGFSTVAFAGMAARINDLMASRTGGG